MKNKQLLINCKYSLIRDCAESDYNGMTESLLWTSWSGLSKLQCMWWKRGRCWLKYTLNKCVNCITRMVCLEHTGPKKWRSRTRGEENWIQWEIMQRGDWGSWRGQYKCENKFVGVRVCGLLWSEGQKKEEEWIETHTIVKGKNLYVKFVTKNNFA